MTAKVLLLAAGLVFASSPALSWEALVDGPDVFGVTKVLASDLSAREGMVIQCNSKDELYIAFVFRKKEFEEIPETPATLYIQTTSEPPLVIDATLRVWNDNYAGIVVTGRNDQTVAAVRAISIAKTKINIGVDILGNQTSASIPSRGSTSAMKKVIESCKLE